jgi:hypothetical protein
MTAASPTAPTKSSTTTTATLLGSRIAGGSTIKPKGAKITTAKGKVLQRGGFGGRSPSGG